MLPGGKVQSDSPSRPWHLANVRMVLLTRTLRRRLGTQVEVRRLRYRLRGWNDPRLDPLRDAEKLLDEVRGRFEPRNIVVVGHSMGGRVAAHLAARGAVGTVVALAPWWAGDDGDLIPAGTRLLVVHGTADTWTDPRRSRAQTERARRRGVDAEWMGFEGGDHFMLRRWRDWHRLTAEFVANQLVGANRAAMRRSPDSSGEKG
ncbi:alpha/beta fold hydrolase [Mycobacterium sp. NPDC006124]|uniref:alpha/beta hydrolase n=1 Tax=Mycobacterium sp. NPDC006124 TaxID=3156729 RepID=UPI0033A3634A